MVMRAAGKRADCPGGAGARWRPSSSSRCRAKGVFCRRRRAFWSAFAQLCTQHGIVMVADEIQCGFGRTGKLFACEHYGIAPDLITTGKSLGAGMPIAAVTGPAEMMDAPHPGGLGGTYSGNPLACVAAVGGHQPDQRPGLFAPGDGRGGAAARRAGGSCRRAIPARSATCAAWGRCWRWRLSTTRRARRRTWRPPAH